MEYDGSERVDLGPKTVGRIYNGTFIGSGTSGNSNGLRLRLMVLVSFGTVYGPIYRVVCFE